jgi:carbamoyl-phosphate synthase large subunit
MSEVDLIVNTTEGKQAIEDSFAIRRSALQRKVVLLPRPLRQPRPACQALAII